VGNQYANWKHYLPTTKEQFEEIKEVLKVDILQTDLHGKISIGHNALAYATYFALFLLTVLQTATGFALYAPMSEAWIPQLFSWLPAVAGGDYNLRMVHHILMWFYILFIMVHVYITFYHDYIEGRGTISSIIGGWKFEKVTSLKKDGILKDE
jgi:Ni/Fe-hydrogenase 1 B-type cytochrome subunit